MKAEPYDTTLKGILFASAGFGCFAIADSMAKYLTQYYSVYNLVFYNGIFFVTSLFLASFFMGGVKKSVTSRYKKRHFLRGIFLFCQLCLIFYAFKNLPMTTVYAIVFVAPILLSLLSIPVLKETVDKKHWLVIITGFAGVLIILRPGLVPIELPLLAALASALFFSVSSLIVRFIPKEEEHILAWGILPETPIILFSFAASLITGFTLPQIGHLWILALGGTLAAIAMIALSFGFIYAKVSVVAPFHYTQIVWGAALGYLIFGDIPDGWTLCGAAIIIASGIWLIRHENGKTKKALLKSMEQSPSHPEQLPVEK